MLERVGYNYIRTNTQNGHKGACVLQYKEFGYQDGAVYQDKVLLSESDLVVSVLAVDTQPSVLHRETDRERENIVH